ncbi:MAG: I78 family peptidase inhibitor [Sphingomonas sp.]
MRRRALMVALIPAALCACAADATLPPAAAPTLVTTCKAGRVQYLVGTVITDAIAKRAQRRAHARALRVLPPGAMMTMDYRTDRLNIILGPGKVAARITCS